ncbi:uncharacterized protein [Dermacentor albipictus]|uniref:uncharacterized protein n=1 Tax=Dermacentor albipictus TaxID=60249 RepID=UPI0031FC48F5
MACSVAFSCPECQAPMANNGAVASHCQRVHRDVHTVARCCGELFFSRGSYASHCGSHHPHAFVCAQCKTNFDSGAQLKSHQTAFVKTYTCPMCGRREPKLAKLTSHVERAHAVILDQRYVLVDVRRQAASRAEKRRGVMRKVLRAVVPCCGSLLPVGAALELSYTCGFGSEDAYREPFVDALCEPAAPDDDAASLEETGESAVRFFGQRPVVLTSHP